MNQRDGWSIRSLGVTGLIVLVLIGLVGCSSSSAPKLKKGRCITNEDCEETLKCVNSFCEDIYHPRRSIKNY